MTSNADIKQDLDLKTLMIIVGLVVQTGVGFFWAGTLSADMASLKIEVSRASGDRYTTFDAQRDFKSRDIAIDHIELRIKEIEKVLRK